MTPSAPEPAPESKHVLRRVGFLLIAPAVCLILFWRAFFTWFMNDDFAWLSLQLDVNHASDLWRILFQPMAQGTVRVFSERLYFLALGSLFEPNAFNVNAIPFRICALLTWFVDLGLATVICARLIGSRNAGVWAAVLWTSSAVLVSPIAWASNFNQILCAFCVLMAFYARLRWLEFGSRRWKVVEWIVYLAGFGVLEIIVMYPFIALLHALCVDWKKRERWIGTLPLFLPAAAFTVVHFFLISKTSAPEYVLTVDHRLPVTLWTYLKWTLAPLTISDWAGRWNVLAIVSPILIGAAVLGFLAWRTQRRDFIGIFFAGWFVIFLLPVLPLAAHISDSYITLPALGLSWLGGWAIATAWNAGRHATLARAAVAMLAAIYLVGSIHQIDQHLRWRQTNSRRLKYLLRAADQTAEKYPGSPLLIAGADHLLIQMSFENDAFRLYGLDKVYIIPGGEHEAVSGGELEYVQRFIVTVPKAIDLIDRAKARVLFVSGDRITDTTKSYAELLHSGKTVAKHDFVNVGDAGYADQLGPTWFNIENGTRWIPKVASVHLYDIPAGAKALLVTGYAPREVIATGPVTIRFRGNGIDIAKAAITEAGASFSLSFPLPPALIGQSNVEIEMELNKVLRAPGEDRELGMIFGTFAIR
jgi:hypothetical protein